MNEVEAVARAVAPMMEGGREFDQMPPTRLELRQWSRSGMCSTNDATQDDATELAQAAIAAMQPDWRPIETAPRDELVWLFEPHSEGGFMFAGITDMDGLWRNNLDRRKQQPTHWMPLPAPPAGERG